MNRLVCYINGEAFILEKGNIQYIQEVTEVLLVFLNKYDIQYKTGKGWILFDYNGSTYKIFHTSYSGIKEFIGIQGFINKLKREVLSDYDCLFEDKVGTIFYINSFGISHLSDYHLVGLIKHWSSELDEEYIVAELTNELLKRGDADELLQQIK